MLDWIFEGIVGWVGSIVSQLMDAVSGLFLEALGTDMTPYRRRSLCKTNAGCSRRTSYHFYKIIIAYSRKNANRNHQNRWSKKIHKEEGCEKAFLCT